MATDVSPISVITVKVPLELIDRFRQVITAEDPEATVSSEVRRYMRWRVRRAGAGRRRRTDDGPAPRLHPTAHLVQNEDGAPRHRSPVESNQSQGGPRDAPKSIRSA